MEERIKTPINYYNADRRELLPFLPKNYSRVLEIGCGEALFTRQLKKESEIWGIEMVPDVAKVAKKHLNNLLVGTYFDTFSQLPDNYFDLIICNDVIEHMADHDQFFRTIKLKMTNGGHIVGSVPNMRHWRNLFNLLVFRDWKYANSGILDRTHLRFFTEKSLKRTFAEHDFLIDAFGGTVYSKKKFNRFIHKLLTVLSLGNLADTKYHQFLFRIANIG